MKIMTKKLFFLFIAAFLISLAALAQPSPYQNTPTARDYPDSDVIVLKEKTVITLMPDGRIQEHYFRAEKVLSYQGMDIIGDPKVAFNKENQKLEINKCRTYTVEGRVADAKPNSFTEMTPYELERSPGYTSIRQMVITKIALDINAVVELEYTITDTKPWRKFLQGGLLIREDCPVISKEIEIRMPAGMELGSMIFNSAEKLQMKTEQGERVYYLNLTNLHPVNHSECSNGEEYLYPYLVYSNCPDWGHQATILSGIVKKAIENSSKSMEDKAASLTEKNLTAREKAMTVHDFVVSKFTSVEWSLADFDHAPRNASAVYESSYGHKLDKAVLLAAMLRSLKLQPVLYFVETSPLPGSSNNQVPSLAIFDDVLVSVDVDGEVLHLDPTRSASSASMRDFAGMTVLELAQGVSGLTTLPGMKEGNEVKCVFALEPKEKQILAGTGSITLKGKYVNYESAVKNGFEGEVKPFVEGVLPQAAEIKITSKSFEKEKIVAEVEFVLDLKKSTENTGFDALLLTALPDGSVTKANSFSSREKRDLAMALSVTGGETYEISMKIPEGFKLFGDLPAITKAGGGVRVSQSYRKDGDKVVLSYSAEAKDRIINQEDYSKSRDAAIGLLAPSARNLVFEEVKK